MSFLIDERLFFNKFLARISYFRFFLWILLIVSGIIFPYLVQKVSAASILVYDSHGKRDPFVPLVSGHNSAIPGELLGVETLEDVRIDGVVYDPRHGSVAIVNGTVLKEGQELGNVKVLKIKNNGVSLSVNGAEAFKMLFSKEGTEHGA